MTQSLTPAIEVTQTGGAQLVTFTPGATQSNSPSMGIAQENECFFIELFPHSAPIISACISSLPFLLTPFDTKTTFAPIISTQIKVQRQPVYNLLEPVVIGELPLLIPYGAKTIFAPISTSTKPRRKSVYDLADPTVLDESMIRRRIQTNLVSRLPPPQFRVVYYLMEPTVIGP